MADELEPLTIGGAQPVRKPAELWRYTPTARERIVSILADQLGGDRAAYGHADRFVGGAEFSPLGLMTSAYDLARSGAGHVKTLVEALTNSSHPVTQPAVLSKEDFYQARRSKRETLEEAQNRAEREARELPEYKDLMGKNWRKSAEDLVAKRKASAETTWQKSQATVGSEEEAIGRQWDAELGDRERRRLEMMGQSFSERHPVASAALPLSGLAGSLLLTRLGLNKINRAGAGYAAQAETARLAGDKEAQAQAILMADKFAQSEPLKKLGVLAGAPLANVEARALPDQMDVMTMPPEAPARQRAMDRMSNVPEYLLHSVPAYVGGAAATYTGSKLAGPSSGPEVAATRAYLRGLEPNQSPQQIAVEIAKRDGDLARALAEPRSGPAQLGPSTTRAPANPDPGAVGRAAQTEEAAALPALLRALMDQGQLPPPAGASSPTDLAKALMDSPANRNFAGHHSRYQKRDSDGSFAKGRPEYPDKD